MRLKRSLGLFDRLRSDFQHGGKNGVAETRPFVVGLDLGINRPLSETVEVLDFRRKTKQTLFRPNVRPDCMGKVVRRMRFRQFERRNERDMNRRSVPGFATEVVSHVAAAFFQRSRQLIGDQHADEMGLSWKGSVGPCFQNGIAFPEACFYRPSAE